MKSFTFLILTIFVYLTDQSFLYSPKNQQKVSTSNANRFIVNIVEYSYVNGTKTAGKFRCLGTLILEDFVLTTASCVARPENIEIGIQFETIKESANDVGCKLLSTNLKKFLINKILFLIPIRFDHIWRNNSVDAWSLQY